MLQTNDECNECIGLTTGEDIGKSPRRLDLGKTYTVWEYSKLAVASGQWS